jgi:hypothetical protein
MSVRVRIGGAVVVVVSACGGAAAAAALVVLALLIVIRLCVRVTRRQRGTRARKKNMNYASGKKQKKSVAPSHFLYLLLLFAFSRWTSFFREYVYAMTQQQQRSVTSGDRVPPNRRYNIHILGPPKAGKTTFFRAAREQIALLLSERGALASNDVENNFLASLWNDDDVRVTYSVLDPFSMTNYALGHAWQRVHAFILIYNPADLESYRSTCCEFLEIVEQYTLLVDAPCVCAMVANTRQRATTRISRAQATEYCHDIGVLHYEVDAHRNKDRVRSIVHAIVRSVDYAHTNHDRMRLASPSAPLSATAADASVVQQQQHNHEPGIGDAALRLGNSAVHCAASTLRSGAGGVFSLAEGTLMVGITLLTCIPVYVCAPTIQVMRHTDGSSATAAVGTSRTQLDFESAKLDSRRATVAAAANIQTLSPSELQRLNDAYFLYRWAQ